MGAQKLKCIDKWAVDIDEIGVFLEGSSIAVRVNGSDLRARARNKYPLFGSGSEVSSNVDYIPWISCCIASENQAKFTFMPVPGDLTGDGKVDIKDLTLIASKYCLKWTCTSPSNLKKWIERYYYDFNKDGHIDIFDIIVVSKNWERTCPF